VEAPEETLGCFLSIPVCLLFFALQMNVDLKEFIADGARTITPAHLDNLVRLLPELRLAATQVTEFPNLPDQIEFLAEIVEDFHAGLNRSIPLTAIAEAAFAPRSARGSQSNLTAEIRSEWH
jgi:hypothetical protein